MTADKEKTPPADADCDFLRLLFKQITGVDVQVRTVNGEFFVIDPVGDEYKTGLVRKQ